MKSLMTAIVPMATLLTPETATDASTALESPLTTSTVGRWGHVAAKMVTKSAAAALEAVAGSWSVNASSKEEEKGEKEEESRFNNSTSVLPSLISTALSQLSTLAESAATTLQTHLNSLATTQGRVVTNLGDNATLTTTETVFNTSGTLLNELFNVSGDFFTSVLQGSTSGNVTLDFYANFTSGSTSFTTEPSFILGNFTPTMELINESYIFTQDGAGGAGAQYRVGPVESGLNDTYNNLTNDNHREQRTYQATCMLYDFIIEALFMGCLCLFGFTGNTLSMICLWRDKSKTATPFLLVSLELADTMFLVTVFLLRVLTSIHMFTGWFKSLDSVFPYMGSYVFAFALISETGSIYLTVLVTVNRYISVCRPYEASDLCSIYHARRHVIFVATFSILFNLPRFFEYRVTTIVTPDNRTIPRAELTPFAKNIVYQIVYANALYFLVMFLIPLVTLIILNYKLIKALRKTKKKRAQLISSSVDSQSRSEDDITLVLIVVVIVFVISQTPALITQSLFSFLHMSKRVCPNAFFFYERISDLMVVANASMNFIIYCFCSTKFRQILVNLLCMKALESPEQSYEKQTRVTKVRTYKGTRGAKDSMV